MHDYHDIISHPMDLSTVRNKLDSGEYHNKNEFAADVRLMFDNCYKYNGETSDVAAMGRALQGVFEENFVKILDDDADGVHGLGGRSVESMIQSIIKDQQRILAQYTKFGDDIQKLCASINTLMAYMNYQQADQQGANLPKKGELLLVDRLR